MRALVLALTIVVSTACSDAAPRLRSGTYTDELGRSCTITCTATSCVYGTCTGVPTPVGGCGMGETARFVVVSGAPIGGEYLGSLCTACAKPSPEVWSVDPVNCTPLRCSTRSDCPNTGNRCVDHRCIYPDGQPWTTDAGPDGS